MKLSDRLRASLPSWPSLWVVALLSLLGHLGLCQFFTFGEKVPMSLDVDPSNLWKLAYHFPPTGTFQVLNWLGIAFLPQPLTPFSLAAAIMPVWWFFTAYAPIVATLALLAMTAFLRELELSRPAALFGGVVYAWQGDIVPFVLPGHYAYMDAWPFFALAGWGALRGVRTGYWAYAVVSGASCGLMVGLPSNSDRGAICSLLVAALWLAPGISAWWRKMPIGPHLRAARQFGLCVAISFLIALAPLLALFQSNIVGVKIGGKSSREETYQLVTQFSLGPAETLTYLVPGLFGWHMNNLEGPYWGWIGETVNFPKPGSSRNLNLAISTTGTAASLLACIGIGILASNRWFGVSAISTRQRFYGRLLLGIGAIALLLAWGWHTPFYRPLFALPLMDKWRNPLKWLELTTFAAVVLSAYGVEHILAALESQTHGAQVVRRRVMRFGLGVLGTLVLGFAASYPLGLRLVPVLKSENYQEVEIANIQSTLHMSLLVAVVIAGGFCLVLAGFSQPERLRTWRLVNPWLDRLWQAALMPEARATSLALSFALLAVVQLGWVATKFIEALPLKMLTGSNPLIDRLRYEGTTVRCSVFTDDALLNTLLQNQFATGEISCLDISAASRIPDDLDTFLTTFGQDRARLWFLSGVKNVAMPQQYAAQLKNLPSIANNVDRVEGYTLQDTDSPNVPSHALLVFKDYLNKATLVPTADVMPTEKALLNRLKDPDWDPRASILVPHDAPQVFPPQTGPAATSDQIGLRSYSPTKIEVDVQAVHPSFVLINDAYDPDWQAEVNGNPVPLLRADYMMRAVAVSPGLSIVTLRYVAHYHVAGFALPAEAMNNLSDAVMLGSWIMAGLALRRRNDGLPAPGDIVPESR